MDTLDLISAIASNDALKTEEAFKAVISEKIAVYLDTMRESVASKMFDSAEEITEEEIEWISEEEFLQLTEEEQEDYLTEEQLDELMGKGSVDAIKKIHQDAANSGRQNARTKFHATQANRAHHIASKIDIRAKYGKDSQHYHEYGSDSKGSKKSYARLSPDAKKKVTKTLGKEYTGKDKSPGIQTKGKTTIHNPQTKAQNYDSASARAKLHAKLGVKALPDDEKAIKGGRN